VPIELGREYHCPVAASIVMTVLADQQDLFFSFLFILIKHASNSLRIITTFDVNLGNGVRQCWGPPAPEGPQKHSLIIFSKCNM
jgi:hypothetical protein